MESNTSSLFELQVDHEGTTYLRETARWAKFLAIVGFIGCGCFILIGIFSGSLRSSNLSGYGSAFATGYTLGITIFYILMAILYFFPCLYTYNFSVKMQAALRNNDQAQMNDSFRHLKASFRFLGILMIVGLGLVVLSVVVLIISVR